MFRTTFSTRQPPACTWKTDTFFEGIMALKVCRAHFRDYTLKWNSNGQTSGTQRCKVRSLIWPVLRLKFGREFSCIDPTTGKNNRPHGVLFGPEHWRMAPEAERTRLPGCKRSAHMWKNLVEHPGCRSGKISGVISARCAVVRPAVVTWFFDQKTCFKHFYPPELAS